MNVVYRVDDVVTIASLFYDVTCICCKKASIYEFNGFNWFRL